MSIRFGSCPGEWDSPTIPAPWESGARDSLSLQLFPPETGSPEMKFRATFAALALAGLCATAAARAADTKPAVNQPAPSPAEKAYAEWMQKNVPGDAHKLLAQCVGEWNTSSKMWMAPGAPPQTTTGTS